MKQPQKRCNTSHHSIPRYAILLILGTLLVLSVTFLSGCGRYGGSEEIYSVQTLESNMSDKSREYDYAADYIDLWDFPRFDKRKMRELENLFLESALYPLPSVAEHAESLGRLFLTEYYNKTELTSPDAVTDALLECYAKTSGDKWAKYRSVADTLSYTGAMSGEGEATVTYNIENYRGSEVGYIKISSFKGNTATQFMEAVDYMEANKIRGIVFDVRDNSGGYVSAAVDALNYLIPVDKRIVTYRENGKAAEVVRATMTHNLSIPCVVLCNENTASAAELFAAALHDYKLLGFMDVTVVGKETFGKGVMQSTKMLEDGSSITLTTAYFDTPLESNFTERGYGVAPDRGYESLVGPTDKDDSQRNDALDCISYLVQLYDGTVSKDRFHEKLDDAYEQSIGTNHRYFSDYLKKWGIPIYDNEKLHYVQEVFESLTTLPDTTLRLAYLTASKFIDEHYDALSVSEKSETTEALIKAWLSVCDDYGIFRNAKETSVYLSEIGGNTVGIGLTWSEKTHKIISISEGSDAEGKLMIGDVILSVNDIEYTFRTSTTKDNYPDIVKEFTNKSKESFSISVIRGEGDEAEIIDDIVVTRTNVAMQSVISQLEERNVMAGGQIIGTASVARITITAFNNKTYSQFKKAIDTYKNTADAFIFDIRSNLGGMRDSAIKCVDYLIKDEIDGHKTPITSVKYYKDGSVETRYAEDGHDIGNTPCIVMCDENTTAAAELFAAAIKDYADLGYMKARLVGRTTFGRGIMQEFRTLNDGTSITVTVADSYPPKGEATDFHEIGIIPHVEIPTSTTSQEFYNKAFSEAVMLLFSTPPSQS